MTSQTETLVNYLFSELANNPTRANAMAKVKEQWQIKDRTFDRAWKVAKDRYRDTQKLVQQEIVDKIVSTASERTGEALKGREWIINELYNDFIQLNKMKAGISIPVIDEKGIVLEVMNPTPFDEVRAKQTRISIFEKIAAVEGWAPEILLPPQAVINNNLQQNNITRIQRSITFKTRTTTVQDQELLDEPEE